MKTFLADGNLLIALTVVDHVHHQAALDWFEQSGPELATCPITQGTLLRFLIRQGTGTNTALEVLDQLTAQPWHHFWPDSLAYTSEHLVGVIGHRQVTNAYLVALARANHGLVASFDKGLASIHPKAVHLLG